MSSSKSLNTRIRNKIDYLSSWTSNNPVLLDGEFAIVKDTDYYRLKVGHDGLNFNSLEFLDKRFLTSANIDQFLSSYVPLSGNALIQNTLSAYEIFIPNNLTVENAIYAGEVYSQELGRYEDTTLIHGSEITLGDGNSEIIFEGNATIDGSLALESDLTVMSKINITDSNESNYLDIDLNGLSATNSTTWDKVVDSANLVNSSWQNKADVSSLTNYVQISRKINGKSLSADVTLNSSDVSAVSKETTVNGKSLSTNILLNGTDINVGGSSSIASNTIETAITSINAKIPAAATSSNQLADKEFVTDSITQGTAVYRGSFANLSDLTSISWQTTDPTAQYYVSNNDYAVVQDDETHNDECWRYIYVTGTGWTAQYMINESPLTQAQLDALNSGATSSIIGSVANKADISSLSNYAMAVDFNAVSSDFYGLSSDLTTVISNEIIPNVSAISTTVSTHTEQIDSILSNKNFLNYQTVNALTLSTDNDIYKYALTANGTSATVPEIDVSNIPIRDSYYKFEIELFVPLGVATIAYPTCFNWLNEDDIPDTAVVEGKTMHIAARFDCATERTNLSGSILVNVWRIS